MPEFPNAMSVPEMVELIIRRTDQEQLDRVTKRFLNDAETGATIGDRVKALNAFIRLASLAKVNSADKQEEAYGPGTAGDIPGGNRIVEIAKRLGIDLRVSQTPTTVDAEAVTVGAEAESGKAPATHRKRKATGHRSNTGNRKPKGKRKSKVGPKVRHKKVSPGEGISGVLS